MDQGQLVDTLDRARGDSPVVPLLCGTLFTDMVTSSAF